MKSQVTPQKNKKKKTVRFTDTPSNTSPFKKKSFHSAETPSPISKITKQDYSPSRTYLYPGYKRSTLLEVFERLLVSKTTNVPSPEQQQQTILPDIDMEETAAAPENFSQAQSSNMSSSQPRFLQGIFHPELPSKTTSEIIFYPRLPSTDDSPPSISESSEPRDIFFPVLAPKAD